MTPRWTVGRTVPRRAAWIGIALATALTAGCGVLNPALINSLGFNPVVSLPNPDGYVLLVYTNLTASSISFRSDQLYANGTQETLNRIVGPGDYQVIAENCNMTSFQLTSLTISVPGGESLEVPSDRGAVIKNRDYACGAVIAVTISGTPQAPEILVEVF